jgi:hypothetical protein
MRGLLKFLFRRCSSIWRYCFTSAFIALTGSLLILGLLHIMAAFFSFQLPSPPAVSLSFWSFFGAVVFAPLIESPLLGLTIWLMQQKVRQPVFVAALAAVIWGALHGAIAWPWFFGTAWSFFVYSCGYLTWYGKSKYSALIAAAIPHALVNFFAWMIEALSNSSLS